MEWSLKSGRVLAGPEVAGSFSGRVRVESSGVTGTGKDRAAVPKGTVEDNTVL